MPADSLPRVSADVEGAVLVENQGEAEQHEHGAPEGDEERLVGLPDVFGLAEVSDQTPAGERGDLPEQVEEDEIGGEDQAHHRADEEGHDEVVLRLVVGVLDIAQRVDGDRAWRSATP